MSVAYRILSILLLSSYLVAMLQPSLPFIDYQLRMDYYAQVLCENKEKPQLHCNGQCVLAQKLKEAAEQSLPDMPQAPECADVEDFLGAHLPTPTLTFSTAGSLVLQVERPFGQGIPKFAPLTPPPKFLELDIRYLMI